MALTRPRYSQIYDTDYKQSVRVATTADVGNLLATGNMTNTVDGVTLTAEDRILVKDQNNSEQNGIYRVLTAGTGSNGTWVRAKDANANDRVTAGMTTVVSEGDLNISKTFRLSTPDPIIIGTTELTFSDPFSAGGAAGANTQVQFNDSGIAGASAGFTFDKTSNAVVITGNLSAAGDITLSATTQALNLGTAQTTGTTTIGGTSSTGNLTVGRSIGNQTVNIATGTVASGNIKNVNVGTGGASGSNTFVSIGSTNGTSTTTLNGIVSLSATTQALNLGTSQTTGAITIGGFSATAPITLGRSTSSHTINIGNGAVANLFTKTLNIGTGGVTGSFTNVTIGATSGTSTINLNGNITVTGNLLPSANITYDLGSPTQRWREGWFSGSTIHIGTESLSVDETGKWMFSSNGDTVELGTGVDFNPSSANISGNVTATNYLFANGVPLMTAVDTMVSTANVNLKSYVDGQFTSLINGSPSTLDTLNEIAAALGNDANLSVTLTNKITGVQGNVTAANAAIVTANTNIKGYVDGQISTTTSAITTANTNMKGYVDTGLSSLSSNRINANASNVTVTASYVNVAINSSNVASFSSTGFTTAGAITSSGKLIVNDTTDFTNPSVNAVQIEGGINVMKTAFFGGNAIINVTTPSTSTSTGALQVTGGAGIGGNLNVGGTRHLITGNVGINSTNPTVPLTIGDSTLPAGVTITGQITSTEITGQLPVISARLSASSGNPVIAQFTSSGTVASPTAVADARGLGRNSWFGFDGSNYINAAFIAVGVDGTPSTNSMPGRFIFATTPSGSSTPLERMRINSSGNVGIANTAPLHTLSVTGNAFVSGTIFGTASSARYADLAEIYTSDKKYIPGTVVVFGGDNEVTVSTASHDPSVAGVVSTNPAYLMNDSVEGAAVALQGRVPCRVLGPVNKGDRVVSSDVRGVAERLDMTKYQPGCIIGKSLDYVPNGEIATIEVVVGRN